MVGSDASLSFVLSFCLFLPAVSFPATLGHSVSLGGWVLR